MTKEDLASTLTELLEPRAAERGVELVAVEQSGGRHTPVVRVLLDCEGGMNIDAICEANSWVSEVLDEADPISVPYVLEVSSPGVDRPLRTREHFERFVGETVSVKTRAAGHERGSWTGTLVGLEGDDVVLDVDGERVVIPLESVRKARLKGVVCFNSEGSTSK
jgi:ribosome maturation factor RimP